VVGSVPPRGPPTLIVIPTTLEKNKELQLKIKEIPVSNLWVVQLELLPQALIEHQTV
jgi:hypothetical protein